MSELVPCPSCKRHVRALATSCPFCATRLGTTPASSRHAIGLVLGLSLAACGDGGKDDGASATAADTDGPGMTGMIPGDSSTTDVDYGGEDYAGPSDTWGPEPWPDSDSESEVPSDSSGGSSGGESGSTGGEDTTGSTGGEGTGSSTGEPSDPDAGGEDYAGPESEG